MEGMEGMDRGHFDGLPTRAAPRTKTLGVSEAAF